MNNTVLHILSKNGSLEFKNEVENAELMARNPSSNVANLNAVHDELYEKFDLLERESDNIAYSEHQRGVIETYRDKLNEVIGLLQNRINEIMNSQENAQDDEDEQNDAYARAMGVSVRRRGGRRKSSKRKSSRRKSIRRKSIRRKSIRRRKY
jgi:hypothetical protein